MIRVKHFFKIRNLWHMLLILVFLIGILRSLIIVEKAWINIGLFRFSKIHENILFEIDVFGESIVKEKRLLQQLTQNRLFDSKNHTTQQALGLILLAQNHQNEALQILHDVSVEPANLLVSQGNFAVSLSLYEQALNWYYKAVQLEPSNAEVWYKIAVLHELNSETDKAIRTFQNSWTLLHANSADPLAELLRSERKCEDAISVWQKALETFPDHPQRLFWWRGLSSCLHVTEKWGEAIRITQRAINEFPADAILHVERGLALYYSDRNFFEALTEVEKAITLDENLPVAYATLGEMFANEEAYMESIYWYSKAIELNPNNSSWQIARANVAFSKDDIPQAQQFFEIVIRRWPNIAYAHYRVALVYRKLGQAEKAIESIEQAIALSDVPNPQYIFRAASIYEWEGNAEKAIQAYKRVLTLDPNNELAKEGIERLSN